MGKRMMALAVLAATVGLVVVAGFALEPESSVRLLTVEAPCPAVGCASGVCHDYVAVPVPDEVHELSCPEAGCSSSACHGWDALTTRYHQASDMSLNAWILGPTALVLGLWLLIRRSAKGGRRESF